MEPSITRGKEFYQEHKELILIISVAAVTYFLTRPPKASEKEKHRKKKPMARLNQTGKSFMSDNSEGPYQDEPSTEARRSADSSGKEPMKPSKRPPKMILERIESSSEEEENEDKIFFEVYKTYRIA